MRRIATLILLVVLATAGPSFGGGYWTGGGAGSVGPPGPPGAPPGGAVDNIQVNDGAGGFAAYPGTTCTPGNLIFSLDASGVATCQPGGTGGGAPTNATYITQTPNGTLSNEQALSLLGTGILISSTGTGIISTYAGTSCTNQFPRSLSAVGSATCATVANTDLANSAITLNGTSVSLGGTRTLSLASGDFANQGTATTVLHGNAAGNPAFGSIVSSDMNITTTSCTNQVVTGISSGGVGTCSTVSNAMLANPSITVSGTSNQVSVSGSPVSMGGTVTLSLPAAVTMPGSLTVTTLTGTPATAATFDSGGKLVSASTLGLGQGGTGVSSAADDTVLVSNGSAWQVKTLPDCVDTGGNHLNYTQSSNTFSCGTSGGGGGAPTTASYWTSTAEAGLSNETNLGALTTGLILNTVGGGTATPSTYAGTSCTNQFPRSLNASGAATCASVANADLANSSITLNGSPVSLGGSRVLSLASADFANQGTGTTLLHGNAAGNPSFGSVVSADMNITTTSCTNQAVTAISSGGVGTCSSVSNAMLSNSSITVNGTTNQISTSGSPVSLGGTVTVALPAAVTAPGTLTVTTRTGTPAMMAAFDSGGKLVETALPGGGAGTGTTGTVPKWTDGPGGVLGDSLVSESGSVVSVNGQVSIVEAGVIQPRVFTPEQVTNGNFATGTCDGWTTTGWTCNAGTDVQHNIGNTTALSQSPTIVAGRLYKVVFTTSGRTAGGVFVTLGGAILGTTTTNTTVTAYAYTTTTAGIIFTPTTDFDGHIDDVSATGPLTPAQTYLSITDPGNAQTTAGNLLVYSTFSNQGNNQGSFGVGPGVGRVTEQRNTWVGGMAGAALSAYPNGVGTDNTALGWGTLWGFAAPTGATTGIGNRNTAVGAEAAQDFNGDDMIAIGRRVPYYQQTGNRGVYVGNGILDTSGTTVVGPNDVVAVGYQAGQSSLTAAASAADGAVAVGALSRWGGKGSIGIGYKAQPTAANRMVVGGNDPSVGGIDLAYFGHGESAASPGDFTLTTTNGSSTTNGASIHFVPGSGTGGGDARAGSLYFGTASNQVFTDQWQVSGPAPIGSLLAVTDGQVSIGQISANRPDFVSAKTSLYVGGNRVAGVVAGKLNPAHFALGSQAIGDILVADSTTSYARLAASANSGWVLTSNGAGAAPSWQAATGGGAPTGASYWTATAEAGLSNETNLGGLTTALLLNTVTAGTAVPSAYTGTSCTNQFPRSLNASGAATCASVATADISANAVTSAQTAVVNNTRVCTITIGADDGPVLTNANLGPQPRLCLVPYNATIVEVTVASDGGTPNVQLRKNHAGTNTNLLSGVLASVGGDGAGTIACARSTTSATCYDGTTSSGSVTVSTTALAAGDWIGLTSGTAGGTAKRMSIAISYTVD